MADSVGKNPTSQGTLPAAHQAIPTLDKSTATQAESQVPGFTKEFASLALTPSAIGEAASSVITQTGVSMAEKNGAYAAQNNPNMQLLPSFSESGKAFDAAYKNESSSILGLQSQKLIDNNLEQLSEAGTLTPGLINSFNQSSAQGVEGVLKNAPESVRASLTNQYAQQLQSQTHKLNTQMIESQKKVSAGKNAAYLVEQSNQMQDAIREQTPISMETAAIAKRNIDDSIDNSLESNQITATQAQSAKIANTLNYESGLKINEALSAKANGTLEKFLSEMPDKKIPGLTWTQSEAVQDNVMKAVTHIETATKRNEQLVISSGQSMVREGTMTPEKLESMRPELTETQFNNLSSYYSIHGHKQSAASQKIGALVSNSGNARAYDGATTEQINSAYDSIVAGKQANNPDLSTNEAEFETAAFMAHPVPKYIDGINNGILGGDLGQASNAMEQYNRLRAETGFKTTGVTDTAIATAQTFLAMQGQYPGDPQEALAKARDLVSNKDEETIKMNKAKINQYNNKHNSTAQARQSTMIKKGGLGGGNYQDLTAFTNDMSQHFDAYMQLTNGNEDTSDKMTRDYATKAYAETHINGVAEIGYLPVDTAVGVPQNGTPLIQSDIHSKLDEQFEVGKQAYDNGTLDSYWQTKPRVSLNDYKEAKSIINQEMSFKGVKTAFKEAQGTKLAPNQIMINKLQPYRDIVNEYEAGKPIQVEQVMRNGTVNPYTIQTRSSPYTTVSATSGEVIGPYLIQVKDDVTGIPSNIHSYFGSTRTMPEYRPDAAWIRGNFLSVNGLTQTWAQYKSLVNKHDEAMDMLRAPHMRSPMRARPGGG